MRLKHYVYKYHAEGVQKVVIGVKQCGRVMPLASSSWQLQQPVYNVALL